jgi:hypothetical protein
MIHPALVNPWFSLGESESDMPGKLNEGSKRFSEGDTPPAGRSGIIPSSTDEAPSAACSPGHEDCARYVEATAGYPCCYNCGYRESCDQWCPHASKEVMPNTVESALADRCADQSRRQHNAEPPSYAVAADRFQIDEYAFMAEIEPVPEFIRRAG